MKGLSKGIALLGFVIAAPLWAHHAAEGIVSDEIWQEIDDNLTTVDSPHLNIDFDDVMGSMRVETDDSGDMFLVTDIYVSVEDTEDYMAIIDQVMSDILEEGDTQLDEANQIPSGSTLSARASTAYFAEPVITEDADNDSVYATISLWEPIGNSDSFQDVGSPPPGTGNNR